MEKFAAIKKLLSSVSSVIALLWLPVAVVVSAVSAAPAFGQTQSLPNPLGEYVTTITHASEIYRNTGGKFQSLQFSADGRTIWLVAGEHNDNKVLIFTLSTGFDPSTVTGVTTLTTFAPTTGFFTAILVTPDGRRVFITNGTSRRVLAYDLSRAFDLSTATAAATAFFTLPVGQPESLAFSSDGRRMFIGEATLVVAQYNLDAPFSFTGTPELERRVTLDVSLTGNQARAYDLEFLNSGATLYVSSAQSGGPTGLDPVFQFDLSTAYDFNTLNPKPSAMAPVGDVNLRGIAFNSDASSIFATYDSIGGATGEIAVYETVAADLVPTFGGATIPVQGYLPGAVVNVTLPAGSGGNGALRYVLLHREGPNLAALGLSFGDRVISGTVPAMAALDDSVFDYRMQDADDNGGTDDRADILLTITIEEDPAPTFSVASIPTQTYIPGDTVSLTLPAATGGNGALSYFLFDGLGSQADLGLTFDGATRVVSGTIPISFTPANDNTFTYRVQDADTNMAATDHADLVLTLNIVANIVPAFSVASIPTQTYIPGETVSLTLPVATGGNGALSYTLINPSGSTLAELGLAFDGNARTLIGTISDSAPLQASMFTYRVQDMDTNRAAADRDDLTLDITVVGPPPNLAATSVAFAGNLPTAEENGVAVTMLTSGQTGLTLNVEVANTAAPATAAMIQVYRSPTAVVAGSPPTVPACGDDNVRCAAGQPAVIDAFASGDATPQTSATFVAPGSNGLYHFFACFTDAAETATLDDNCTTTIQARVGAAPPNPDVPGNGATAVRLVVPGTFDSDIESVSDDDGFVVALVSGGTYQIDAMRTSGNLDTGIALFPPGQAFFGSDCNGSDSLAANDDFGSGSNSRITHAATQTGDHLLCVYGSTITQGNYRLTAAVTVAPPVAVSFGDGGTTGAVTEDDNTANTATGTLTITSGDGNTDVVAQTDADGEYGLFSINADGGWTYTLGGNTDNDNAVNALAAGATIDDTFTVVSAANSAATVVITITITGANDAPTVAITAPATDGMQVLFGASVTLTASGADPDAGNTLTYEWSANPGVGTFANANAARTTWTAPASGTDPVTLTLTATDDAPMPATDTAQVTVNPVAPAPDLSIAAAPVVDTTAQTLAYTVTNAGIQAAVADVAVNVVRATSNTALNPADLSAALAATTCTPASGAAPDPCRAVIDGELSAPVPANDGTDDGTLEQTITAVITPADGMNYYYLVCVTVDADTDCSPYSTAANFADPLHFSTDSVADQVWRVNEPVEEQPFMANSLSGGSGGGYTYALSPIPPGVTFDSMTRRLSGTPTGTRNPRLTTLTGMDSDGTEVELMFMVSIVENRVRVTVTANGMSGTAFTFPEDVGTIRLAVTAELLPAGSTRRGTVSPVMIMAADGFGLSAPALQPDDYLRETPVAGNPALEIPEGVMSRTWMYDLEIVADSVVEFDEMLLFNVSVGGLSESRNQWTITITDPGTASIELTLSPSIIYEDSGSTLGGVTPVMATVRSLTTLARAVDISLSAAGGTAEDTEFSVARTDGRPLEEFGELDQRVLSITRELTITPVMDTVSEGDETVILTASGTGDDAGITAMATLTIRDGMQPDSAPVLSGGINDQRYSTVAAIEPVTLPIATGGNGPLRYSIAPELPAGLSFDDATRVLSGTATSAGTDTFTYTAHDTDSNIADSDAAALDFMIQVTTPLTFGSDPVLPSALTFLVDEAVNITLPDATGTGTGAITYAITETLPNGLSFTAASRVLSGTPTVVQPAMTYTYTATDSDTPPTTVELTFSITIRVADVPGDGSTTTRLMVPGTLDSDIENVSDEDVFLVALVLGGTYQIDAMRTSGNLDTGIALFQPGQAFFGSDCDGSDSLAANNDFGSGSDSRITHAATQTGDHLLCVYGSTTTQGNYRLTAAVTAAPPVVVSFGGGTTGAVTEDDNTANTATGTLTITSGDGNTDVVAQTDADGEYGLFSINADGGWTYTLGGNTDNENAVNALAGGTVADPVTAADTFTVVSAANSAATVVITITITGANDAPTVTISAPATDGIQVEFNSVVTLTATGEDVDTGDTANLTYAWTANPNVGSFANANAASTMWTAPASGTAPVTLTLTATDDDATTPLFGMATVTVNPVAVAITFDDGTTGGVNEGDTTPITVNLVVTSTGSNDVVAQTGEDGQYGEFSITAAGVWTYTLDNSNAAINPLAAGATLDDPFTVVAAADSTATVVITITITGVNDAPTPRISAPAAGTDVPRGATINLVGSTSSDPDTGDTLTFAWDDDEDFPGTFGDATAADTTWTAPDAITGVTLKLTVSDGTAMPNTTVFVNVVDIVITIIGDTTGEVTEDGDLTDTGALTVTSNDGNNDVVAQTNTDGTYGLFSIGADGAWTYTLGSNPDNETAVNALHGRNGGDEQTDTFTVAAEADPATTVEVVITVTGANDAPTATISAPTDGADVEFGVAIPATGTGTDPDTDDTLTYEWTTNPANRGSFANAALASTMWTAPNTGTDPVTLILTATDDAATPGTDTAEVIVNPVAPAVTFGGVMAGAVTEAAATDTTTATGTLTFTTASSNKNVVAQTDTPGTYGSFTITAAGAWTYTLDNAATATNALAAGATVDDTFTVTASVNPTATVDVTITVTGRNDPPVAVVVINGVSGTGSLSVNQGAMVTLDGSGSDPDAGNTLSYAWTVNPNNTGSFASATSASTIWTAPTLAAGADDVTATLTLTVTDNNGADSDPVTVAVTVIAAPVISIPDGLTASVNADGNGGTAGTLTVVNLPAPDAAVAFTSLERVADSGGYGFFTLDAEGGWEYELDNSAGSAYQKLSDTDAPVMVQFPVTATVAGFADALSATLTITVTGRDDPPVAVVMINGVIGTGGSISVAQGAMVTLDGSGSSDPDNDPMTYLYLWTQTGGQTITLTPGGTDAMGRAMSADQRPTFTTPPARTPLEFMLAVTAGGDTDTAMFTVQVMNRGTFDNVNRVILPEVTRAMVDTTVSAIARRVAAEADASPGGTFNLGGRSFVIGAGGSRDVSGDAFNPDGRKNTLAEALWKNKEALAGGAFSWRALADELWTNKEVLTGGAFGLGGQRDLLEALWANKDALIGGARQLKSLLGRSAFALPLNQAGGPLAGVTLWGNGAYRNLSGNNATVDWDGDLFGATVGGDTQLTDTLLTGLAVSWADGTFDYTDRSGTDPAPGTYQATLTSLHPYVSTSLLDGQVTLWATGGYGWGEVAITDTADPTADGTVTADTRLATAAVGGAGRLLNQPGLLTPDGTTTVRVKAEVLTTAIKAEQQGDRLAGLTTDARRLRLTLEGSHEQPLPHGAQLTPSVGVGLRHDAGDGRTGTGAEVSGGLRYAHPALRLTMESRGRVLLAHGGDYDDWSVSGRVTLAPGAQGQGLAVTLAPTYQTTTSAGGLAQLWEHGTANRPAPSGPTTPQGLMDATVAYGLPVGDHLLTPYGGMTLGAADARTYRLGSRVSLAHRLNMSLEGARKGATGTIPVDHGVRVQLEWHW